MQSVLPSLPSGIGTSLTWPRTSPKNSVLRPRSPKDGRPVRVSRQRAILRKITAAALAGDIQAAGLVLSLADRLLGLVAPEQDEGSVADQALLEEFVTNAIAQRAQRRGDSQEESK